MLMNGGDGSVGFMTDQDLILWDLCSLIRMICSEGEGKRAMDGKENKPMRLG